MLQTKSPRSHVLARCGPSHWAWRLTHCLGFSPRFALGSQSRAVVTSLSGRGWTVDHFGCRDGALGQPTSSWWYWLHWSAKTAKTSTRRISRWRTFGRRAAETFGCTTTLGRPTGTRWGSRMSAWHGSGRPSGAAWCSRCSGPWGSWSWSPRGPLFKLNFYGKNQVGERPCAKESCEVFDLLQTEAWAEAYEKGRRQATLLE